MKCKVCQVEISKCSCHKITIDMITRMRRCPCERCQKEGDIMETRYLELKEIGNKIKL